MRAQPSVVCIVLNWNGWQDTLECLSFLNQSSYGNLSIAIVDNGSTDDSAAKIRAAYPDILLLESERNLGFAGGYNIGLRHALKQRADYVWLLNNDTKPHPGALSALIGKASTDRRIGAVASVCYYMHRPEVVQAWAGAHVNLWIGYARNTTEPHRDDWFGSLYGASLLVALSAIKQVGLLDEGFFVYWEETELCLRLRKAGWLLAAAPESRILHKVAASTGRDRILLARYFTASGLRILRLHSPAPHLAMLLFLTGRLVRRMLRLQLAESRSVWSGLLDYRRSRPITPRIT